MYDIPRKHSSLFSRDLNVMASHNNYHYESPTMSWMGSNHLDTVNSLHSRQI